MYYIYHIPTYVWKDGAIGKIGCTDNIQKRINQQGKPDYEILEEYSCIYKASDREIELQKEYGYPVDTIPYWKMVKIATKKSRIKGGKIGGKIVGKKNAESGHMSIIGKIGGKTRGKQIVESGHIKTIIKLAAQKKRKPVIQYDLEGSYIAEWISASDVEDKLGLSRSSIAKVCKGKLKKCGGFIWKYKKNPK